VASAAWALSTVMMKTPLQEIEPLTAQAIRLPLASALLWLTPWTRGAGPALRAGGRGPLRRIGALSDHRRQLRPVRRQPQASSTPA
jgi:hypothetical protein